MSLQPAIEGMLGYLPDAVGRKLILSPWFPADWDSAMVQGIRIGNERINMEMHRAKCKGQSGGDQVQRHDLEVKDSFITSYHFNNEAGSGIDVQLRPVFPAGCTIEKILVNSQPLRAWALNETPQGWVIPEFGFGLDSTAVIEIYWHGGITALPLVSSPQPGERSIGFRIIDTKYSDGNYTLTLQAPRASRQEFRFWATEPGVVTAEGAIITGISGNIITLTADFANLESDDALLRVIFHH
jgi:hypothetical protein